MKTSHQLHISDARDMSQLADASVQLVVTSPPYPMIAMWDEVFAQQNPDIGAALSAGDGLSAFELMHIELDKVWAECFRVLSPGGFACINIGDATRTISGDFRLYHNHARIVSGMAGLGFTVLPDILWRKPTNAPSKFMGSGMLPAGAYVTYEHEYILVLRKGGKRVFRSRAERRQRARSAFFWEERNLWFSDVWMDLRGAGQSIPTPGTRGRSAAFPLELPYRLISMYSAYGDTVLDPFVGTGTTMAAAVIAARSSIGIERAADLADLAEASLYAAVDSAAETAHRRLAAHRRFVEERLAAGKALRHWNEPHDLPVMTRQERELELVSATGLTLLSSGQVEVQHKRFTDRGEPAPPPAPRADDPPGQRRLV